VDSTFPIRAGVSMNWVPHLRRGLIATKVGYRAEHDPVLRVGGVLGFLLPRKLPTLAAFGVEDGASKVVFQSDGAHPSRSTVTVVPIWEIRRALRLILHGARSRS
jgi:hypothetical protein